MRGLAFSTLGCPGWSAETTAAQLQAAGYNGVELRLLDGEVIDPGQLTGGRRQALRRTFAGHGLAIVCLGASSRFTSPDPGERETARQHLLAFLELAADLECPLVRTFGGFVPAGEPLAQAALRVADSLSQVAPRAQALGVTVGLETHDDFSAATAAMAAVAAVDSRSVSAIWDLYHTCTFGETVAGAFSTLWPRLCHVHVKDGRRRSDGDWEPVLLGQGEIPVAEALGLLSQGGYDGWITVEWEKKWHPHLAEPEVAVPHHAHLLRPLIF